MKNQILKSFLFINMIESIFCLLKTRVTSANKEKIIVSIELIQLKLN